MKHAIPVLSAVLVLSGATHAGAAMKASDLVANSPFVPVGWSPTAKPGSAPQTGQQYVFKGVYSIGEDVFLCVNNSATEKSVWVKVGTTVGSIKAISYDPAARKATISVSSRELTLTMPKPKDGASPVGVAVNSQGRARPILQPTPRPGTRRLNRMMRNGNVPPPPWVDRSADIAGARSGPRWNGPGAENGGNTGGNTSNPGDSGGSTTNPTNPTTPTSPTTPDTPTENPGGNENNPSVPPAPPAFVPDIPDSIRDMINNGAAPVNPQ